MKRNMLRFLGLGVLLLVLSIKGVSAVSMTPEYSDNVQRYIVKSGSKANLINKVMNVKPKTKFNLDYKRGSKFQNATYTSSNTKIATVNKSNGVVYFKKDGKVTIYVKGADNKRYKTTFAISSVYISISISKQRARLYVGGKLRKNVPVVTGRPSATPTPKGTFKIAYKQRNTYLDGATVGYDYYLKVKYWMPLAGTGGVGLHDAPWRSYKSFGGSLYKRDGSHGCINMRTKDAAYFYKYIKAGTTVKIY